MQKITPFLWFDSEAEEAANLYVATFAQSRIVSASRYGDSGQDSTGQTAGTVMTIQFELEGQQFMALNGGPLFKFNESVSLLVSCETQEEIDHMYDALSAVPESEQCGWLKDKFGLSWQIVPPILGELLSDPDTDKAGRVMAAMLKMKRIDIAGLQAAANG
ncbi:VOC family protein [Aeromicrobium sp.]|nr:VOC family protein [Candidatus Saccharibacteria bacterium]